MAARLAADPGNNEARFGLGLIRFARAIERYGQSQYRYGLRAPRTMSVPLLRFPVPVNPAPEEVSYEKQRETLTTLLDDLAKVEATLAPMTDAPVKIVLDLNAIKFDLRGDGKPDDSERLSSILASLRMTRPDGARQGRSRSKSRSTTPTRCGCAAMPSFSPRRSNSSSPMTGARRSKCAGPLFYPRITPPPFGEAATAPSVGGGGGLFGDEAQFAESSRSFTKSAGPSPRRPACKAPTRHLKQVIALNRQMWKAILARTDDDRVWIPGPQQKHGVIAEHAGQPGAARRVAEGARRVRRGARRQAAASPLAFRARASISRRSSSSRARSTSCCGRPATRRRPISKPARCCRGAEWADWQRIFNGKFPAYAFWFN